jgi:hypothetical protein
MNITGKGEIYLEDKFVAKVSYDVDVTESFLEGVESPSGIDTQGNITVLGEAISFKSGPLYTLRFYMEEKKVINFYSTTIEGLKTNKPEVVFTGGIRNANN